MSDSWHSYPSVYALGHKAIAELLLDPVIVQEKIDGSQFSFGLFEDGLRARSKGAMLQIDAPEKMFAKAVEYIKTLNLIPGWTYRAEWLAKPKHNALAYERTPKNGIILFDINVGEEDYLPYWRVWLEADHLGLEVVPKLCEGYVTDAAILAEMLERDSCLGGQKIEGVVIKNYQRFGPDKKVLMGKFVSEKYKEVAATAWKKANPAGKDIVMHIGQSLATEARWRKAVQHLRDAGRLEGSPRDIGLLFKEVPADIEKEETEAIKDALYSWARSSIMRIATHGLAEWYKRELMAEQFTAFWEERRHQHTMENPDAETKTND